MKLINNRFRVIDTINHGEVEEFCIVKDLHQKEKIKFLSIYYDGRDKKSIDYLTKEFNSLVNIKHKNLIESEKFDIIESINQKKTKSLMYYILNEYIENPRLIDLKENISLENSLKIILQLMRVIDYIHFRGYVYKHLSPTNIFVSDDYSIKIRDLASIYRDFTYSHHNYLTELFIDPEIFSNNEGINKYVDYYSIGMIMKYLLFKGLNIDNTNKNNFKDEFILTNKQKIFLLKTIKNLTHKDAVFRNISLMNHIKDIIATFNLNYDYDLVKEREHLILNTSIVGRDKEINTLLEIDKSLSKGIKKFSGVIISGRYGSGKTKLLNEMAFRFTLMNRSVLHLKGKEDAITGGLNVNTLLKASFKYAPNELINKYNDCFNELLKYNTEDDLKYETLKDKASQEKYRIYNRLTNYFADLSKDRTIYILIDDIDVSNDGFINFLKYMMFRLDNNKVFIIVTIVDSVLVHNKILEKNLKAMNESSILHIELNNLTEADTGKLVKAILGLSYIPIRFTSYIYKESLGNPNYIYYIIKDLYRREELHMSERGVWETIEQDYNKIIISMDGNNVINSRIENIDDNNYKVLEIISLSKSMITRHTLKEMLEIDEEEIGSILESLVESRIVDDKIVNSMESLSIYSTELKRIVYSRISNDDKIKLHKQVANCIIRRYEYDYQFVMEELIYHLKNSGQYDYALKILLSEAEKQSNRYSSYSISLWEHAYNLVKNTDNDEILNILNSLITIYDMKGYVELTGGYITKMQRIALEKDNLEYLIKAKYHQVEIYINTNQLDLAESLVSEAEKIVNNNKDLYEGQILLLMSRTKMAFKKSQFEDMEYYLKKAVKVSEEHNIIKYLGNIYNLFGLYYYLSGMPQPAIEHFNKSIKYYEQDDNIIEEFKPINNIGNIYANVYGEDDKALEYFQKGYRIASKYKFAKASFIFTSNIGNIYYRNLQMDEALQYFETSRNISNETEEYRGITLSNLSLGMIYLSGDKYDKADEVFDFIEEINNREPIVDSEVLTTYYTFMGRYNNYYGKLEESLKYYRLLSEITRDYSSRENLYAESNILIIEGLGYSEYKRDRLEKIIKAYQSSKMNNMELEVLLFFAVLAVKFNDIDFANEILDVYSKFSNNTNESLRAFREAIDVIINPSSKKLLSLESYLDSKIYRDYRLNINTILANEWAKLKNYKRALRHCFKALDNILKRAESIKDKDLRYYFIKIRNGDILKSDLSKYLELSFNKKIDYISLDEAYEKNKRYNDMIHILNQLEPFEYREIKNLDNRYEEMDTIETLLNEFTDDYQRNLDLTLNYLGYETLANRGFILMYNKDDSSYRIISSLVENDTYAARDNLLSQSNRNSVGILINKNFKNMEDSKYIELLPDEAISIICVPLTNSGKNMIKADRRKKGTTSTSSKFALYDGKSEIYIYLESDSYLNKFEYDKLILIKQIGSLILLNTESKYLKDITIIDKLTGVLTRKHFDLQIDAIIEKYSKYQGSFSLLMIDIDNFKGLNDTYGHLIGDDILSIIGTKLLESIRSTDLAARYGGDEFIIALFDTSIEEGLSIAEKIRKNILNVKDFSIKREISASIGLSQYPNHGQTKKELIRKADQALYIAKEKNGKNSSLVWTLDMDEGINSLNKLAGILTGNINKDNVNISAIINTIELIDSRLSESEKTDEFTNMILDVLEAQYCTFIKCQYCDLENVYIYKTRIRNIPEWVETPKLNMDIVKRVIISKKGEFLVDWDDLGTQESITEEPIWQSILVLPLIKNDTVWGLIYLSVPLKEKEFTFEDFNLGNLLSKIFAAGYKKE